MSNGYIAVEAAGCGEDITYWVLNQQQMDEVEASYEESNDYCEAMNEVIEAHDLGLAGQRCGSIVEAIATLAKLNLVLVEDFNYIAY